MAGVWKMAADLAEDWRLIAADCRRRAAGAGLIHRIVLLMRARQADRFALRMDRLAAGR